MAPATAVPWTRDLPHVRLIPPRCPTSHCCPPCHTAAHTQPLIGVAYRVPARSGRNWEVVGGETNFASHCPRYQYAPVCVYTQRKESQIPATAKAVQLQDAFDDYDKLMRNGGDDLAAERKRKEIRQGLEQLARTQQLMKMLADAGMTPWFLRRLREIERDLNKVG